MDSSESSSESVFVGCYTKGHGGDGVGVLLVRRDPTTGALGPVRNQVTTPAPSFVVLHPTLPVLYAVHELDEGEVSAFALEPGGDLRPLSGPRPSGGSYPCHAAVDPDGRHLMVANYGSGSVAAIELDSGGALGALHVSQHSGQGQDPHRQKGPHAHMAVANEGAVLAVDLGTDTLYRHPFDEATGRLLDGEVLVQFPPGTGPRHLARDRMGRLHVCGELSASVTTLEPGDGGWKVSAVVPSTTAGSAQPSGIVVSDDGRFLYVANRGTDTIAVFALDGERPRIVGEVSCGGSWPRDIVQIGQFLYAANERSNTVVVFRLDPATGQPQPTGDVLATPSPTCVRPWPARQEGTT
ncbi:MAG TPA: lactonase family protein [Micromonosporaceae bacterium]|nr:lactonase family protein [Micromonosporaceae bacterium]